jgi:hypothetical protein
MLVPSPTAEALKLPVAVYSKVAVVDEYGSRYR